MRLRNLEFSLKPREPCLRFGRLIPPSPRRDRRVSRVLAVVRCDEVGTQPGHPTGVDDRKSKTEIGCNQVKNRAYPGGRRASAPVPPSGPLAQVLAADVCSSVCARACRYRRRRRRLCRARVCTCVSADARARRQRSNVLAALQFVRDPTRTQSARAFAYTAVDDGVPCIRVTRRAVTARFESLWFSFFFSPEQPFSARPDGCVRSSTGHGSISPAVILSRFFFPF